MMIRIEDLRCREDVAGRMKVDDKMVNEYRHEMDGGAMFPALDVFVVDGEYVVVDGYHRLEAHRRAGHTEIECRLHEGDLTAAKRFAACANQTHGLRRNMEDKRLVITTMLTDPEMAVRGDAAIAHVLGLNARFVTNVRNALESGDPRQQDIWVRRRGTDDGADGESESEDGHGAPAESALLRLDPAAMGTFPAIEVTLPADIPIDEIASLPIGDLAEDVCVLIIMATWQRLSDAEALIDKWKFTWQGTLLARPSGKQRKRQRSVTVFGTRGHGGLGGPDALIERAYQHGEGISLFRQRPGWKHWPMLRNDSSSTAITDQAKKGLRALRARMAAKGPLPSGEPSGSE